MKVLTLQGCIVRIWAHRRYLETIYPDGTTVPASPQGDAEYVARAKALGYGADTWGMCREHELLHSWLCENLGLPHSPTLKAVSEGRHWDHSWQEEDYVKGMQAFLNGLSSPPPVPEALLRYRAH
ncbi:MAG: hypothetical protein M3315_08280 [Actinomycetota bacterium]|nr:hypothetical protein [Actinomycetota bacterium]